MPQFLALADSGTFSNTTTIAVPGSGTVGNASPYPSTISVTGLTDLVTDVNVTLTNFSHTYPDDIDILLVGPTGIKVILMSDAGSGTDINNVSLTFDQSAGSALPDNTTITSGTYRPGNYGNAETFPTQSGPFGSSLDEFNSTDPNGTWNLYVVDDLGSDAGSIGGGWSLAITSGPANLAPTADNQTVSTTAGTPLGITLTGSDPESDPLTFSIDTNPANGVLSGFNSATGAVTYTSNASYTGSDSFTFKVNDGVNPSAAGTVTINVSGDAPVITSSAVSLGMENVAYTHTFTAVGNPTPTLSYSAENLPPGVTRSGDTLSGIPTLGGSYSITVTASNGVSPDAVQVLSITIGAVPTPPPPPPAPHAEDINFDDESAVRTGIPDSLVDSINIRELYRDGSPVEWLGGDLYTSGSIGNLGVMELGVMQAIDIFSPGGMTYFNGGAVFCLRGEGTLIWMAASHAPRLVEIIGSYTVPEFPGYTCATLFEPGTLVLVNSDALAALKGE
ncbi:MAG: cadherin-like domain-containing protein [Anaerolineae bacterium]|nr:cadherin-like domain-containing protein [Anaerolineae bacterium]